MKLRAYLLILTLLVSGCTVANLGDRATTIEAILAQPQRVVDAFTDPVRRKHIFSRIAEASVGAAITGGIVLAVGFPFVLPAVIAGVLGEYFFYEFISEPAGWTGYYWERGERDDEEFIYP